MLYNRKAIAALMDNKRPPIAQPAHSDTAVFMMAGHLLSQHFGVPIVHDITNWLRIGDITFLRFNEEPFSWKFQTVEIKSSAGESRTNDDGSTGIALPVSVYSNEPFEVAEIGTATEGQEHQTPQREVSSPKRAAKEDRRIDNQIRRLNRMARRRDMPENTVTTIDGIPNLVFRSSHEETHHWTELRRSIRMARRDGYAFFSIDGFIGYAVLYRKEGVREADILSKRDQFVNDVQEHLLASQGSNIRNAFLSRQIPMEEDEDLKTLPVMRFYSYNLPQKAISDFIRNRLLISVVVNTGRVDTALVDLGFNAAPADGHPLDLDYPYSIEVEAETGESFRVGVPSTYVLDEIDRAVYEFSGLDDVLRKVAVIKQLPEHIPLSG